MNQIKIVEKKALSLEDDAMTPTSEISQMSENSVRSITQIQGAMTVAKRFPRDEVASINKIKGAAKRRKVAEQAAYEYSKGGTNVFGPSIRAAEVISLAWGNMMSGVTEVKRSQEKRESLMLAYAADLESNTWKFLEWRVPHTQDRSASKGGAKALESGRDIYERTMNDGSRRLRNCLLALIPGDITDTFMEECDKTLSNPDVPLVARLNEMHKAMSELGITQPMIEQKMGCNFGALTERQLAQLRRIYQSIKDGFSFPKDWFNEPANKTNKTAALKEYLNEPEQTPPTTNDSPSDQSDHKSTFDQFEGGRIESKKDKK